MLSNEKLWKYNIIWKKGNRVSGFLNAKKQPLRNHEDIMVFYKKQPTYNPQMTIGQPLHGKGSGVHNFKNSNYGDFKEMDDTRKGSTLKYPKSVLTFDKPHPSKHPTEKPVELLRWIIKTYSNEGEVVLDNCMGCGSTIIAAIKENRKYIGMEIDPVFYEITKKRIEEIKK
jgi:site-specific DNA-methyltransferase (adenine-specific)